MASVDSVAVKVLKKDYKEILKDYEDLPIKVYPLESNYLKWHFTLKGAPDSPYDKGLYHGCIEFPSNFPHAPPNFFFLTHSGRFHLNSRVCLTITGYHKECWSPAWSVRTMLLAIRTYMLEEDSDAIGYIWETRERRSDLAKKSREETTCCGTCGYNPSDF